MSVTIEQLERSINLAQKEIEVAKGAIEKLKRESEIEEHTPKVGDVYLGNSTKYHVLVLDVDGCYIEYVYFVDMDKETESKDYFLDNFTYQPNKKFTITKK